MNQNSGEGGDGSELWDWKQTVEHDVSKKFHDTYEILCVGSN